MTNIPHSKNNPVVGKKVKARQQIYQFGNILKEGDTAEIVAVLFDDDAKIEGLTLEDTYSRKFSVDLSEVEILE